LVSQTNQELDTLSDGKKNPLTTVVRGFSLGEELVPMISSGRLPDLSAG
jgi:hypothetical protein